MDLGLDGRVALVTGSWRGTGAGVARVLAAEGATVLVHGLEAGTTGDTLASIEAAGGVAHAVHGDIRTDAGAHELVASVQGATDRVDILVNNYGVADGTTWDGSDGPSWHDSYDTNVVSAIRVTNALVPGMRTQGWGRIVFVATVGATRPGDRIPEYYAAKGALPSVTVSLAKHLAGTGITVNCVSPGVIATPEMVESFTRRAEAEGLGRDWPAVERMVIEQLMPNPTGRVPFPEDVGRFIAMVVSESSWHLNGAHLRFDGGATGVVT